MLGGKATLVACLAPRLKTGRISSKLIELSVNIDHWCDGWSFDDQKAKRRWGGNSKGLQTRQKQPKDVWQPITFDGCWWSMYNHLWSIYNQTMVRSLIEPCWSPRLDSIKVKAELTKGQQLANRNLMENFDCIGLFQCTFHVFQFWKAPRISIVRY